VPGKREKLSPTKEEKIDLDIAEGRLSLLWKERDFLSGNIALAGGWQSRDRMKRGGFH